MKHRIRKPFDFLRRHWVLFLLGIFSIILGILIGLFFAYQKGLPTIETLETLRFSQLTQIYADDGTPIGSFALEKRVVVPSSRIPDIVKKAFVAAEDKNFYKHWGFDPPRILKALWINIKKGKAVQGASTITQQLARMLFLTPEKTLKRKIKELLLAIQLERKYTKDQILTYYLNNIYLGHGNYGVEAASRYYFEKHVWELQLHEAAMLAALPPSPYRLSPYVNPKAALARRNVIIDRMLEEHYITPEEARKAKAMPLSVVDVKKRVFERVGDYFLEEVRRYLEKKYGAESVYKGGLRVYTTMNIEMQRVAEEAVRWGLRELDKRIGWRKPERNVLKEGIDPMKVQLEEWRNGIYQGRIYPAVVLEVTPKKARLRVASYTATLSINDAKWTRRSSLTSLFKRGDIISVMVKERDEEKKELKVSLEQMPLVEGAMIVIVPSTGEIKAIVGGYSFKRSQFDRAIQALRQTGSTIKPIVYTAALMNGWTPASIIVDEPVSFIDPWTKEIWEPKNYKNIYKGWVTLRRGLEESRNVVTAKLVAALTPELVVKFARKFGITSDLKPYLSIALGAFEVSLLEMTSAFSVFPNQGMRVEPYFIKKIEDSYGNLLEVHHRRIHNVIPPEIAYQMTYMLQGVVERGTARRAKVLKRPVAGKTGTTDEFTDAWFIGFTPSLVAGVWVGYDVKKSLGRDETGARAALPIWIKFFQEILKDKPVETFPVPPNIIFVKIDSYTGKLAMPFCTHVINEAFIPGTEPKEFCSEEYHKQVLDYYGPVQAEH